MTEPVRHKSFTKDKNKEPVSFELDGDTFYCAPKMPMSIIRQVAGLRNTMKSDEITGEKMENLLNIMRGLMFDESVALLDARIESKENPIDIKEISDIIAWLLEVYGLRPFQESSDSVSGSSTTNTENVGISLTDGAPVSELIPSNSPQTDS